MLRMKSSYKNGKATQKLSRSLSKSLFNFYMFPLLSDKDLNVLEKGLCERLSVNTTTQCKAAAPMKAFDHLGFTRVIRLSTPKSQSPNKITGQQQSAYML